MGPSIEAGRGRSFVKPGSRSLGLLAAAAILAAAPEASAQDALAPRRYVESAGVIVPLANLGVGAEFLLPRSEVLSVRVLAGTALPVYAVGTVALMLGWWPESRGLGEGFNLSVGAAGFAGIELGWAAFAGAGYAFDLGPVTLRAEAGGCLAVARYGWTLASPVGGLSVGYTPDWGRR